MTEPPAIGKCLTLHAMLHSGEDRISACQLWVQNCAFVATLTTTQVRAHINDACGDRSVLLKDLQEACIQAYEVAHAEVHHLTHQIFEEGNGDAFKNSCQQNKACEEDEMRGARLIFGVVKDMQKEMKGAVTVCVLCMSPSITTYLVIRPPRVTEIAS